MNRIAGVHSICRKSGLVVLGAALAGMLGGCHWDSYLDPSVVGRWERTPNKAPILTHLAPIEGEEPAQVEITNIRPEDLLPEPEIYRIAQGDSLQLIIWDLIDVGRPEAFPRVVDNQGMIEIPQLGRVPVLGLTEPEATTAIARRLAEEGIVSEPLVSVNVEGRRAQTFNMLGAVPAPGPYLIPSSEYRILEALAAGGGFPEFVKEVYVIRQVPLVGGDAGGVGVPGDEPEDTGEDLLNIIDDLGGTAPSVRSNGTDGAVSLVQPADDAREPAIDLIQPDPGTETERPGAADRRRGRPLIDVPDRARWVYLPQRGWVRRVVSGSAPGRDFRDEAEAMDARGDLITQRVIRVPVQPLLAGDARYNIVVRPGDLIRVPSAEQGNVYIGGQVARPGVYTLPVIGKLTLTRAITAAGGLNGLAIPERVDLTRIVGDDLQATIMLDLRAIEEGTQPDIYLRSDDRINIGTTFWATPLAVIRNGFRFSYGFGFLLDRNFGNDVFGAPPSNVGGGG